MVLLDENMEGIHVRSACPDVISVKVEIGKDIIFILLVYTDVREEDRNLKI